MKYKFRRRPYHHQRAAIQKLWDNGFGGALLMEPRTGKTKTTIDYAAMLHQAGKVNRVLIVCPVGVMSVWVDEIRVNCPFRFRITIWDKKGRKKFTLPPWGDAVLDFVIINYDAFSAPGKRTKNGRPSKTSGRLFVRNQLRKWGPQLMVLDESHRIKSPNAKRTTAVVSVAWKQHRPRDGEWWSECLVPYRVIATGTAVTKKKRIFDLYSQWKFLNPDNPLVKDRTLEEFRREFGVWKTIPGENFDRWKRNKNEPLLRRLVHQDAFAVARDECFDLPPRTDQIIHVDLDESGEIYDEMAREMVAMLQSGEYTEASIRLVLDLRLSQITSGIVTTTPTEEHPEKRVARVGSEKLEVLKDLLSDLFEADQKIIVCARWKADISAIETLSRKLKAKTFVIRGGQKRAEREQQHKTFEKVEGPACIVMQPAAGGLGIDLRSATTMIWYSLTNSYVDFTQAEDRNALSPSPRTYMYLLARGTIDELRHEANKEDGDVVKAVTASPERLLRNFKM